MYANVLNSYMDSHEEKGDPYFFLIHIISHFRVIALLILLIFNKLTLKSRICTAIIVMGKPCWSPLRKHPYNILTPLNPTVIW